MGLIAKLFQQQNTPRGCTKKSPENLKEMTSTVNQPVKLAEYEIHFEKLIDEPSSYALFRRFLHATQCEDGLLFLEATTRFDLLIDANNRAKAALDIYHQFVKVGSKYELNVSASIRSAMIEHLELLEGGKVKLNRHIFKVAQSAIMNQLKEHSFPMFKLCSAFHEFLRDKPLDFIETIADRR